MRISSHLVAQVVGTEIVIMDESSAAELALHVSDIPRALEVLAYLAAAAEWDGEGEQPTPIVAVFEGPAAMAAWLADRP